MIIGSILSMVLSAMSIASFLLGAVLAGIGIFLMASKDMLRSMLNLVDTSKLPSAADDAKDQAQEMLDKYDIISFVGLAVLIIGAFIAAVSFCGAIGSMCKLKLLLLIYMIVTGVMLVALVIGIIYFGSLKARMDEAILIKMRVLRDSYFISLISVIQKPDTTLAIMTVAFNFMQVGLKCCGVEKIGDVRSSDSWLTSERRLTELNKQLGGKSALPSMGDEPLMKPPTMSQRKLVAKNIPNWLKKQLPAGIAELPKGATVPASLPASFSLPPDFKDSLANLTKMKNFTKESLLSLFSSALTIKTPLTCCKLSNPEGLMKGKFDTKDITKLMEDPSCPFTAKNDAVNDKICYDALLDYISSYQKIVVTVGTILAAIMGGGIGCALWIFLFD
uniref:Tetraspanin n=1 Tax=Macrostomum lignano TaxID=282301 RepID=A0A1I8IYA4_9PLAT